MTAHIAHADVRIGGLVFECPRCQEHAEHPQYLDEDVQRQLVTWPRTSLDHEARRRLIERDGWLYR